MIKQDITGFFWEIFQKVFGSNSEKLRIYRKFADPKPGENILDFGCATGLAAIKFSDVEYLGVDLNVKAIESAKNKYPPNEYPNIKFLAGNILDLELKKHSHILFAGAGHHIFDDDLISIINCLGKYLTDGGIIHFIDIVKTDSDTFPVSFMYAIDQGRYIRSADQYQKIFTKLVNFKVSDYVVEKVNNKIFKYNFAYFCIKNK